MSLILPAPLQLNTIAPSFCWERCWEANPRVFDWAEHNSYFGLKISSMLISTIFANSGLSSSSCPSSHWPAAILPHRSMFPRSVWCISDLWCCRSVPEPGAQLKQPPHKAFPAFPESLCFLSTPILTSFLPPKLKFWFFLRLHIFLFFHLQYIPNTNMPVSLCSLIFFLRCDTVIYHL